METKPWQHIERIVQKHTEGIEAAIEHERPEAFATFVRAACQDAVKAFADRLKFRRQLLFDTLPAVSQAVIDEELAKWLAD